MADAVEISASRLGVGFTVRSTGGWDRFGLTWGRPRLGAYHSWRYRGLIQQWGVEVVGVHLWWMRFRTRYPFSMEKPR